MTAEDEDLRFQEHMKWLGHVAAMWSSRTSDQHGDLGTANVERWIGRA